MLILFVISNLFVTQVNLGRYHLSRKLLSVLCTQQGVSILCKILLVLTVCLVSVRMLEANTAIIFLSEMKKKKKTLFPLFNPVIVRHAISFSFIIIILSSTPKKGNRDVPGKGCEALPRLACQFALDFLFIHHAV